MELLQQLANTNHICIKEVIVEETALQVMTWAQKKKLDQGINNKTQEEDEMQLEAGDAEEDKTKEERTQDEDKETPEETETILEEFNLMMRRSDSQSQSLTYDGTEWRTSVIYSMQLKSE